MRDSSIAECLKALGILIEDSAGPILLDKLQVLMGGFIWSKETHKVVDEAARQVHELIHQKSPEWEPLRD